jgi:hypothetical protein
MVEFYHLWLRLAEIGLHFKKFIFGPVERDRLKKCVNLVKNCAQTDWNPVLVW